ncbi:MAG: cytochrome b5 domain-containing protein [Wenzhouxiangellaceae bacterium]
MRKTAYTAFVMFWAAVGTLLALHLLAPDELPPGEGADSTIHEDRPAGFTLAEVARHNRLDDCWMAIEGSVYDLTDYIPRHPTRPELLEPWCGTEATVGMRTKGNDSDHSARAWRMLDRYRIGELVPD